MDNYLISLDTFKCEHGVSCNWLLNLACSPADMFMCWMVEMLKLMVLWAILEVSRCVASNKRVCCEAGVTKVLMGYKLLLASYVGGYG